MTVPSAGNGVLLKEGNREPLYFSIQSCGGRVGGPVKRVAFPCASTALPCGIERSEEHTSELQSQSNLVCRLLLEKKKQHACLTIVINVPTAIYSAGLTFNAIVLHPLTAIQQLTTHALD